MKIVTRPYDDDFRCCISEDVVRDVVELECALDVWSVTAASCIWLQSRLTIFSGSCWAPNADCMTIFLTLGDFFSAFATKVAVL